MLRRAQIDVTVAGISLQNGNYAKCSRGVMIVPDIVPDKSFSDISIVRMFSRISQSLIVVDIANAARDDVKRKMIRLEERPEIMIQ